MIQLLVVHRGRQTVIMSGWAPFQTDGFTPAESSILVQLMNLLALMDYRLGVHQCIMLMEQWMARHVKLGAA